ncbi:hypothetical protein DBR42_23400 [Pelomonas sp. HMWF004]|nr:hypothetical protein DBR42_23400 [Pelomonas sp. HMWF004]
MTGCIGFPRMQVSHTVPDDGPLSRLVVKLWMNSEKDLQRRVEALIAQSPQQRTADLEALGLSCSAEPAVRCSHASQFRYRITPAPATRPEGVLELLISAWQEAGSWRVAVSKTER